MSTIASSRRTDTAVLIHAGSSSTAAAERDRIVARGLHCADVRVDVGGVLPAPERAAFAVVVDFDELSQRRHRQVAGWLRQAGACGVPIVASADEARAAPGRDRPP